ncbi:glycoside hydrolase family 16 protein [Moheibacter lacus]|uniref:Glycoside hydrolase family 16 protein n=1 Tax=Moheibacter lacus TaxID=2745851 RepID=A0A838ZQS6_9FLAO|nr:glycoside hydrolase family 16 protein [Moheibacter lacus]MBA5629685.1 glycoside hydrolase family 16 protein [Moheibacter lacus]
MKIKQYILPLIVFFGGILTLNGCNEDDPTFGEIIAPSNLAVNFEIQNVSGEFPDGDGSGIVNFTATADHAMNFKYYFGDNTTGLTSNGTIAHAFAMTGVNTYTVTVVATGTGGTSTSTTTEVTVFSSFSDPETKALLTGGSTKNWYIAKALPGHLGLGPMTSSTQDWYSAAPFEKDECFYNDLLTFTEDADGDVTYTLNNQGETFFNVSFLSVGGGSGSEDTCLPFDTSGVKNVTLSSATSGFPEDVSTGTQIMISDGGFMGYYVGQSNFEIMEISDDYMYVRFQMAPPGDTGIAWYMKFTTDPNGGGDPGGGDNELETEFTDLFWADEFDQETLNMDNWNFEIGNNNGWGNQELQYYTEQNTTLENGILRISAKREAYEGFQYTSSRINTKDKFNFTHGRMEVRAKLPQGGGTWPAIWMLGSTFDNVGWPACGEIDVMEHWGNEPTVVQSALHFPGNSGGNAVVGMTNVDSLESAFHLYTVEWTDEHILFAIDNIVYHEFSNNPGIPFNAPFFIILNVAMGGALGGEVDPNFQEGTFEIDYVRVYQ